MSYEIGAIKWPIGMLLTPVGYVSLYIFGDGIINTLTHLEALLHLIQFIDQPQILIPGLIQIYIPTPETVLQTLWMYPLVGGIIGALLWYRGNKFR